MENGGSTSSSSGSSSSSLQASMQEFKLFETQSNFYMIGWNGNRVYRVLKIDRLDASEITLRIPLPILKKNATSCLNGYTKTTRPQAASNWSLSVMASLGSLSFGDHTTCGHRVYEVSKSEIISLRAFQHCKFKRREQVQEAPVYGGPYKGLLFQLFSV